MLRVVTDARQRHLVRSPAAFDPDSVDVVGTSPSLGRAHHDHRPTGALGAAAVARPLLDGADLVERSVERLGHRVVDALRVVARDEPRRVPVALHQRAQLVLRDPREHRRVGDLVAVEVQHRQYGTVAGRVEELVRVPARRERTGLRLAVADHTADDQARVVERRAVPVRERVPQFPTLVDRAGGLRRDVARDAAGERELAEQPAHALGVLPDRRIPLGIGALQPCVGHESRAAMAGAGHVEHLQPALPDRPVAVRIDEIEPRRRPPVPEQPRLHVLEAQRLAQQRVVEQVDLTDREVVRRTPVGVQRLALAGGKVGRRGGGHALGVPSCDRR